MSKISGQLLISGQFQDNCEISGISGQLGAMQLCHQCFKPNTHGQRRRDATVELSRIGGVYTIRN